MNSRQHVNLLQQRISATSDELIESCKHVEYITSDRGMRKYGFSDNGSSILAVAHCDVVDREIRDTMLFKNNIYDFRLDDRLGVHILLDLLPRMGIVVDVLLTDLEESGQTTAEFFETTKRYNWLVQFDRRGTDCVTYKYGKGRSFREYSADAKGSKSSGKRPPNPEGDAWDLLLEDHGFRLGQGSFSDICALEHLGCKGMNIGTAYYNEHSHSCFANFNQLDQQLLMFSRFFEEYQHSHFPHTEVILEATTYYKGVPLTKLADLSKLSTLEPPEGHEDSEELGLHESPDDVTPWWWPNP